MKMKTNNNDDKRAVALLSLTERIFKMKKNNKTIASIIAFTSIITTAIIMSDVTDNVKMLLFILTIPFAVGSVALLIAERGDVCCDIEADSVDYDDDETEYSESNEIEAYVDEWVELLQLDEIDDIYAARMKRNRQIQNIHQEIHEMAVEADKRIAELCGMC